MLQSAGSSITRAHAPAFVKQCSTEAMLPPCKQIALAKQRATVKKHGRADGKGGGGGSWGLKGRGVVWMGKGPEELTQQGRP